MDIERIQKLNQMVKEYKQHDFDTSDLPRIDKNIGREESSEMSESEKILRKLNFRIKYNEDEIKNLKGLIENLKGEIEELKKKHKEEIQKEFNSKPENIQRTLSSKTMETEDNRKKLTEPIDRNNVAPADVSIEKMFYFGQK